MKRIFCLLIALLLLATLPVMAFAHDYVQMDRTDCTIEVVVRYDGENVTGGTVTAVKVGDLYEEDGNYFFRRVGDDALLENVQSSDTLNSLLSFYDENKATLAFEEITEDIKEGSAKFEGLMPGLYLICQEQAAEGFSKLSPFLVSVPYLQNGEYIYDVTARNKPELEPDPQPTEANPSEPDLAEPVEPTEPMLPQTGQLNWPIPVLTVAGLSLFVVGWILCFGRKRARNEK